MQKKKGSSDRKQFLISCITEVYHERVFNLRLSYEFRTERVKCSTHINIQYHYETNLELSFKLPALVVYTYFICFAIWISATARLTCSFNAHFTRDTVAVSITHFHTYRVSTSLSHSTVWVICTRHCTQVVLAWMSWRTLCTGAAACGNSHTSLLRDWITHKTSGARTLGNMVHTEAHCVWTANTFFLARIY